MKQYFPGIDGLKGTLILLVILGHLLQGDLMRTLPRYLIYSFHMPLFFAVSGYLLRRKLGEQPPLLITKKYLFRVGIPWIVAVLTYYVVQMLLGRSQGSLLHAFLIPQYHLWFISTFLVFVAALYLLLKLKIPTNALLFIGVVIAILVRTFYPHTQPWVEIFNTYRFSYFLFFTLGFWLRNSSYARSIEQPTLHKMLVALLSITAIWQVAAFFSGNAQLLTPNFYLFNLLLATMALPRLKTINFGPLLAWIGKNSLPIYLWHVAVIVGLKPLTQLLGMPLWYLITGVMVTLQLGIIRVLTRHPFINKYLFGNP